MSDVSTMNLGLRRYNPNADFELHRTTPLSKLPGVAYPEPSIEQLQATGPAAFMACPPRRWNREQLEIAPDRMASMWYPICPTLDNTIEPFAREGSNTRWQAKAHACQNYSTRPS